MQTREQHLAWCKERALAYRDRGDTMNALTSMFSDLDKHKETAGHIGIALGLQMMVAGLIEDPPEARRFIEGFN